MNFDSETMGNWFGLPDKKNPPSTYCIDYVRSWKRQGRDDSLQEYRDLKRYLWDKYR